MAGSQEFTMAIEAQRDSLEGLDESVASLYREQDGKFVLDVTPTGGLALEDVSGLKSALEKERENGRRLKAYEGIDPEAAREALRRLADTTTSDKKKSPPGDDMAARAEQLERKFQESQTRLENVQNAARERAKRDEIAAAIAKHGGNARLLIPILDKDLVAVWSDDHGPSVRVRSENGGHRMTLKPGETSDMTVDEYVSLLKQDDEYKVAFAAPPAAGSGARSTNVGFSGTAASNPWKKSTWNFTEQMRLAKEKPELAKRLKADADAG